MRRPILVVEDDELLGEVIAETLTDVGYRTIVFTRPESALRYFETDDAALVLTDLTLGGMDGWEFIERMRQRPDGAPSIVVMTGSPVDAQSMLPPVRAVLTKPFELSDLLGMVARWAAE